jgi:hypothetical protein
MVDYKSVSHFSLYTFIKRSEIHLSTVNKFREIRVIRVVQVEIKKNFILTLIFECQY